MTIIFVRLKLRQTRTLQGPLHVFTRIPQSNQSGFGIGEFLEMRPAPPTSVKVFKTFSLGSYFNFYGDYPGQQILPKVRSDTFETKREPHCNDCPEPNLYRSKRRRKIPALPSRPVVKRASVSGSGTAEVSVMTTLVE